MPTLRRKRIHRAMLYSTITFIGCCVFQSLGLLADIQQAGVTPLWPAAGWIFACYWRFGKRVLPAALLGTILTSRNFPELSACNIFINAIDVCIPLIGVYTIRRVTHSHQLLTRLRSTISFIFLGALLPAIIASAIATALSYANGSTAWDSLEVMAIWFMADFSGILIFAPFFCELLVLHKKGIRKPNAEVLTLFALELLCRVILFSKLIPSGMGSYPINFLFMPLTFWASLRLTPQSAAGFVALSGSLALIGTALKTGPFGLYSFNTSLLLVQLYAVMHSITIFVVNTLKNEQHDTYHRLERTQDATIISLATLAETRDNETGNHILRTQHYVRILAEELAKNPLYRKTLNRRRIKNIEKSAPLHDIGKVGIPDAILLKPARLTQEEFDIMKTHAEIGMHSLRKSSRQLGTNSFLRTAQEVAWTHHERWDGKGYPRGLAGRSIPLSGRIMALADVYDALTTQRVYKPALCHADAKNVISRERAAHFDPIVVDAFLALEKDFESIAMRLADA